MSSTLAVPATSAASGASKEHRNLLTPPPAPASSRPIRHKWTYPVWNLVKVPLRILSPPKATGMVGSVRSLKATPILDVRLADVIANKHLSPLSLKDFEGFLVYKEYSAENLYFILWLNEYEKEYQAYMREAPEKGVDAAAHLPEYLATSLRRGLDTFFAPDAPLELNLPRATRDKTLAEAGSSGDPKDFAAAREIVEQSLARSLNKHARSSIANAGPRRLVFCFCLGLTVFLIGLVPPLVAIGTNHARGYRVIGLPFIMLGVAVMVMAVNRICGVIWLLGEDRQLLPYELAAPTVMSGSIVPIRCPSTPRSSSSESWDEESAYGGSEYPSSNEDAKTSADPYPWEKEEATAAATTTAPSSDGTPAISYAPSSPGSRPPSYRSGGSTSRGLVPDSAPVWGPVTAVFSPDVARAQWRIAAYALVVGAVGLCTVGVVLMAVPNAS
ncbi:hypothetical protein JCM8202_003644 [Rhodotorula sphaerocarpa]